jgi:sirohydrochlorin cobaltochelatase
LNENSAVAAKREAEKIRALGKYAAVLNVYMEEPPLVSDWRQLTKTENVVVVPFFISDGLHSFEDIPRLLGMVSSHSERSEEQSRNPGAKPLAGSVDCARDDGGAGGREIFRANPHRIDGRNLFYAPSIGTDPGFADVIIEQAKAGGKS